MICLYQYRTVIIVLEELDAAFCAHRDSDTERPRHLHGTGVMLLARQVIYADDTKQTCLHAR